MSDSRSVVSCVAAIKRLHHPGRWVLGWRRFSRAARSAVRPPASGAIRPCPASEPQAPEPFCGSNCPIFPGHQPEPGLPPSLALSVPREGYNNPPISGENLIGLSRARRPHNAIFVNFEEDEVPAQPLEAAVQTWRRVCTNPLDWKVEEELKKVSWPWPCPARPRRLVCACGRCRWQRSLFGSVPWHVGHFSSRCRV